MFKDKADIGGDHQRPVSFVVVITLAKLKVYCPNEVSYRYQQTIEKLEASVADYHIFTLFCLLFLIKKTHKSFWYSPFF